MAAVLLVGGSSERVAFNVYISNGCGRSQLWHSAPPGMAVGCCELRLLPSLSLFPSLSSLFPTPKPPQPDTRETGQVPRGRACGHAPSTPHSALMPSYPLPDSLQSRLPCLLSRVLKHVEMGSATLAECIKSMRPQAHCNTLNACRGVQK